MRVFIFLFLLLLRLCICEEIKAQSIPSEELLQDPSQDSELYSNELIDMQEQRLWYRKRKINLNTCTSDELLNTGLLTVLQVEQFFFFRKLLGPFQSIYEMQSVPGWDLETIRDILPLAEVKDKIADSMRIQYRWDKGKSEIMLRMGRKFVREELTQAGSPTSAGIRYRYKVDNRYFLQVGAEKDAGELWWLKGKHGGPDHFSISLSGIGRGVVRRWWLGDLDINFGSGIVIGKSFFATTTGPAGMIKMGGGIRPHTSFEESLFTRGGGIELGKEKWQMRLMGGSQLKDFSILMDTMGNRKEISRMISGGYHRTPGETEKRKNARLSLLGVHLTYMLKPMQISLYGVEAWWSVPWKSGFPYDQPNRIAGKSWWNMGAEIKWITSKAFFYGELALDKEMGWNQRLGILWNPHKKWESGVAISYASPYFLAPLGDNFNGSQGINEREVAWRLAFRPSYKWNYEIGIKYLAEEFRGRGGLPGEWRGEYGGRVLYRASKNTQVEWRVRLRESVLDDRFIGMLRMQIEMNNRKNWQHRIRLEFQNDRETGMPSLSSFLGYWDLSMTQKPDKWGYILRIYGADFDKNGPAIYFFEREPGDFSISRSLTSSTIGFQFNLKRHIVKKLTIWFKYSSGLELGEKKVDLKQDNFTNALKIQLLYST